MTISHSWVLFYVHDPAELRDQQRLDQFFLALARCNCFVALDSEMAAQAIWRKHLVEGPELEDKSVDFPFAASLQPGISEYLCKRSNIYIEEQEEQLTLIGRSMARSPLIRGFTFSVTLVPNEGYLLCSIEQERFFRPTQRGVTAYRYWLKILEAVFIAWQPIYAYEFLHKAYDQSNPSWEQLYAGNIPGLHHLNIYGTELLRQIGAERLFNAPAWLARDLAGQGCLLIPTDPYGFTPASTVTYDEVAAYLCLPSLLAKADRE